MMTTRGLFVTVLTAVYCLSGFGGVGEWRNFTSMKEVRSVARAGTGYWAATSGGLFRWDETNSTFLRFTNADGLQSIDLTAVATDSSGNGWSGSANGYLQVCFAATHSIHVVPDIATTPQSNKKINSITVYGDTALIATDFGLSIFRLSRLEFGDTYTKFGTIPRSNRVTVFASAIHDGKLWVAVTDGQTNNGVAVATLSNPNLLPPDAWTLQIVGSPTVTTTSLGVFAGRLYAGTSNGVYYFDNSSWVPVSTLAGKTITGLATSPHALLTCTASNDVYMIDTLNNVVQFGPLLPFTPTGITSRANGDPLVGSLDGGLLMLQTSWSSLYPAGPNGSQFNNIAVDPSGILWGASGSANGKGFYRYDGTTWKSFTKQNSLLPTNDFYKVSVGCNGSVWASSWGGGIVEIPVGADVVDTTHIYGTRIGMVGLPNDPAYLVLSNTVCDSRGNTWMSIGGAADKNILVMRRSDGSWARTAVHVGSVSGPTLSTIIEGPIDRALAVDGFDNLWMGARDPIFKGVMKMSNGGSFDSVATLLTVANGLPSNDIRTIVIDRDDNIWVGTDKGIGIILNPQDPTQPGSVAAYKPLTGLVINTIAVDPLNQKWVGTSEGVVLLSSDGTQQISSFTVESTGGKLINNDVKSIAVDPKTGTVYFGSTSGLASLSTPALAPKTSFENLTVYPNPYRVPNATPLTVDGLVENATIKILTIDGRVIREVKSPGGRVGFWDGKDRDGTDVSSGIYIIVAYSEDGSQVVSGKVAVLKR